jgi:hypothetical protein
MAQTSVALAVVVESRDIHLSACRYRHQGLVCSTCCDVIERAERAIRAGATVQIAEAA